MTARLPSDIAALRWLVSDGTDVSTNTLIPAYALLKPF